jgi:hypothetical protein
VAWCELTEGAGGYREEMDSFLTLLLQAYDSVDRGVLWLKLMRRGFGGAFLKMVQALYTDDNFVTSANGEETRKIFLRRGLRQGCSMR